MTKNASGHCMGQALYGGIISPIIMRRILTSILCISLFALLMAPVSAGNAPLRDLPSNPNMIILESALDPQPVEAGGDMLLTVVVQNYGEKEAKNVTAFLDLEGPFSFKYASEELQTKGNICEFCNWKLDYHILVDPDARSGTYESLFRITRDDGTIRREETITMDVSGKPDVVFDSPAVEKMVKPGDEFTVKFQFRNIGTGIARNVKVDPSSDKFIVIGSSLKVIDVMKPGEGANLTMGFSVDESVSPGTYLIPVELSFLGERGDAYNTSGKIGMKILHGADLNLQDLKIEPLTIKRGDKVTVQVRVENVGDGRAENVKVTLDSDLSGNKKAYVGGLEKDDDAPAIFTLMANNEGELKNKLIITYTDDFGAHNLTEEFALTIKNNGNNDAMFIATGIIALSLVAIVVYLFSKRKKE